VIYALEEEIDEVAQQGRILKELLESQTFTPSTNKTVPHVKMQKNGKEKKNTNMDS
jgi:hypothetical protein